MVMVIVVGIVMVTVMVMVIVIVTVVIITIKTHAMAHLKKANAASRAPSDRFLTVYLAMPIPVTRIATIPDSSSPSASM